MFQTLFMCFHPFGVVGGGGVRRLEGAAAQFAYAISTLHSSKMEISETDFFDLLTIRNDQICCIKHVLDPHYGVFTLFGCLDGGGGDF